MITHYMIGYRTAVDRSTRYITLKIIPGYSDLSKVRKIIAVWQGVVDHLSIKIDSVDYVGVTPMA